MRALGLTDTIFYNLRDAQITAAAVLDGPCDLATLVAGIEGAVATLPAFAETPLRLGVWSFARPARDIDLTCHVAIAHDSSVTRPEHLVSLLDRLRRNRLAIDGPQWRIVALNPAGTATDGALSAVFGQVRHGLADGTRIIQALTRAAAFAPTAAHAALAQRLPALDFGSLPANVTVHDTGPIPLTILRTEIGRDGDASLRLADAVAAAVADVALFPHAQPLRGNIGRTRMERRRGSKEGAGNHVHLDTIGRTVPTADAPARKRRRIPGLSRAQELPLSQWAVAVAPGPLARMMMRMWYASFDGIATLIPLPRRFTIGGRGVTGLYAAPPLWGPVPLAALAFAAPDRYDICLYPGEGFTADPARLAAAIRANLTRDRRAPPASRAG